MDNWVISVIDTVVHELRHIWQRKKNLLLYVICCIPIIRQFTIELGAKAEQQYAREFFDEWDRVRYARIHEEKLKIQQADE